MKNLYFRTFLILIYRKHYLVISKIKNVEKHLTITNKCFILYAIIKGCEIMEENKLAIQNELTNEDIKNLIYTIRGKQVMLDSDVARLYHYETRRINETVKRNIERFPIEFCFQLNSKEYEILKSQIATSNIRGGKQKLPYVFTEKGILMLSGLLKKIRM